MPRRSPVFALIHVVWATARRRPLLPPAFDASLAAILGAKAKERGCVLVLAGFASDHVHLVVRQAPSLALAHLVGPMKGASAFDVNPQCLLPHRLAWQHGYWAESLCPAEVGSLAAYFRGQRQHHDDSHPAERWQFADDEREPAEGRLLSVLK
jgi:REP element-mobilizing transposase RayT